MVGSLFAIPFSDLDIPDCLHFRASRTKNLIHTVADCYTDLRNFIASFFSFLCSSVFSWSNGKKGTSSRSNGWNWDSSTWYLLEFEPQQSWKTTTKTQMLRGTPKTHIGHFKQWQYPGYFYPCWHFVPDVILRMCANVVSALPSPQASFFLAAKAFRITWSMRKSDTSPKRIDREGLGKRRTGTRQ